MVLLFIMTSCWSYKRIQSNEGCNYLYTLSTNSYNVKFSIDEIENIWRDKGYEIQRDTVFGNKKDTNIVVKDYTTYVSGGYTPRVKVYNYESQFFNNQINYIVFNVFQLKKPEIHLYGICLKSGYKEKVSTEDLKGLNKEIEQRIINEIRLK